MHFFQLLLALPALASAAEVRLRYEARCNGGYLVCSNIPSGSCCGGVQNQQGYNSVGFVSMPRNSNVFAFQATRDGNNCGAQKAWQSTGGGDNACLNFPGGQEQFSGGAWNPGAKKRRFAVKAPECTNTVMADALVLDDGVKFDLTDMGDDMMMEVYGMLQNGTKSEDVPEPFKVFEVAE